MDINCVYYKRGHTCSLIHSVCNHVLHMTCLYERPCLVKKDREKKKEEKK
jgi:hypothetical protein